jgi:hypothetical protein
MTCRSKPNSRKPRRLYPSGQLSLVPADYVPPLPVHEIICDGMVQGRKVNTSSNIKTSVLFFVLPSWLL